MDPHGRWSAGHLGAALVMLVAPLGTLADAVSAQTLTATRGSFTIAPDSISNRQAAFAADTIRIARAGDVTCLAIHPRTDECVAQRHKDSAEFVAAGADADQQAAFAADTIRVAPAGDVTCLALRPPTKECVAQRLKDSAAFVRALVSDSLVVSIVAEGSVRSALTNGSMGSNTPAGGALGVSVGEWRRNLTVLINVAGLTDTLKQNVGAALLPPTAGGLTSGQVSALLDFRQMIGNHGFGLHFYGSVTPAEFEASVSGTEESASAVVEALGAQASWEFYNQSLGATAISVVADLGLAGRAIGGDVASPSNRPLRNQLLATNSTNFGGLEAGLTLFVKDVRVGVSMYFFPGNVPGLSHAQAVFGVSVSDEFLSARSRKAHNLGLGQ